MMSEKQRFEITDYGSEYYIEIIDNKKELDKNIDNPTQRLDLVECCGLLNEFELKCYKLEKENEQLRLELETHKHPLWSTREAEKKVNKLADSLADEVKKNGLLNEEINQLRIENMRLKKKCGDEMSEKNCEHCKHFQLDGMFGLWCEKDHDWTLVNENCSDFER